tara:strand:+ start:1813 stop:2577 length:765 start_codon:yes stop_codon:yes gene_type:complete
MSLKTPQALAIEKASPLDDNKLLLHGNSSITGVIDNVHVDGTNIENTFLYVFDVDCKFFYSAGVFNNNKLSFQEIGIGHLEFDGSQTILHRDRPAYFQIANNPVQLASKFDVLDCSEEEYIIVTSYTPQSISEFLYDKNCIITSQNLHSPISLEVENNSLIVCHNDKLQSVDFKNIKKIGPLSDSVKDIICSYTKQIALKTSRLDVSKIKTKQVQLEPNKKPDAKEGALYYDKETKQLKYFDGNIWQTLQKETE